jgi:DMATS type aromatic prenyltransferase
MLLQDLTIEDDVRSQRAFGFDLKETGITCKRYSFPGLKIQLTGKNLAELLSDKLQTLRAEADYTSGFETVQKLMQEDEDILDHAIFSWDCVSLPQSRLKFYGLSNDVSWARIEKVWTKNGRTRTGAETVGLQRLRKLWDLLGLTEGVLSRTMIFEDRAQQPSGSPLVWNYEIKPGSFSVAPKVYFPVYGVCDDRIVVALSQFFHYLGLKDLAATYRTTVQSIL